MRLRPGGHGYRIAGLLVTATALLFAGAAAALAWAQFRGFDMLDGGYYLLLFQDPSDNFDTHTRFQLFARPLWLLCRQNIVAFRLASLAATTAACWPFWRAFRRHLLSPCSAALSWWPLWLASMAALTWVPVAPTYNSLATVFSLLGLALLIYGVASQAKMRAPSGATWLLLLALSVLGAGLYLVKPPAAAAFGVCCCAMICLSPAFSGWVPRITVLLGVIGILAAVGASAVLVAQPGFGQGKLLGLSGLNLSPAWVRTTMLRYDAEVLHMMPSLWHDLFWTLGPTVALCSAILLGRVVQMHRHWQSLALWLFLAAALGAVVQRRLWDGSFAVAVSAEAARFYLVLWCSLIPVWIVSVMHWPGKLTEVRDRKVAWIVLLFALPLVSSFGSTNTPYVSALHETVFWSAGLLLVSDQIALSLSAPWFRAAVSALLCLGAAGHIYTGLFLRPYMFQPSLWKQTQAVDVGYPATSLLVDPELAEFIGDVRMNLEKNGYRPGDDVFGFFNLPGLIFAIGARQPGAPWYFGTWYHQDDTDGGKLRRVPLERRQRAWIITQADVRPFRSRFLECGIDFPDGYTMIGRTINPTTGLEIGIWKPRARN